MGKTWNLKHLGAISIVANRGSLARAAEEVSMSQPSLSNAISCLEQQFGVRLFERTSKGMHLTSYGQIVVKRIHPALINFQARCKRLTESYFSRQVKAPDMINVISTTQIQALIAVIHAGSYSSGARALGLSQPTIHRTLGGLEQRLGITLVESPGGKAQPTRSGLQLAQYGNLLLNEIELAVSEVRRELGEMTGRLRIGALPVVQAWVLPMAIDQLVRRYPDVNIKVVESPYEDLLDSLKFGDIDMLIGSLRSQDPPPDTKQLEIFPDDLSVVARAGHPLADRSDLSIEDLLSFPWVVPRSGSQARRVFNALVAGNEARVKVPVEASSLLIRRRLLLNSDLLTIASTHQFGQEHRMGSMTRLEFTTPSEQRWIGVTTRSEGRPTALQEEFIALLRQMAHSNER